jgi:Na+-transporting methylmalonyl-CoA/oxaloacetate decarboxylase gamma subunit
MLGALAMEVAAMGDGVVIMLVGMGVVFLFLIVLMGGIRLMAVRRRRQPAAASGAGSVPRPRSLETSGNGLRAGGDPAVQRAAAVAVALELARRASDRAGRGVDSPTWRDSGRVWHHRGPQAVATVLAGRRGAR